MTEHTWSISKCVLSTENNSFSEYEDLVTSFIDGYDVGLLFLSVGAEVSALLRRHRDFKYILSFLEKGLETGATVEYVYLGVTDEYCYDIRDNRRYSNSDILNNGVDSLMTKTQRIADIWRLIKIGSIYPFVLKIRITLKERRRQHSFTIVDLKHPRFLSITPKIESSPNIYYSFAKLRDSIDLIASFEFNGHVPTDSYVLTDILSGFLGGLVKFHVVSLINVYLNETIRESDIEPVCIRNVQVYILKK
ncbi:hypothetical protein RMATCC62417_00913 [Rhizopus microsporus]|nr:hypothetical protein RMATCC62417_00913 [Rhizopus microsporus]